MNDDEGLMVKKNRHKNSLFQRQRTLLVEDHVDMRKSWPDLLNFTCIKVLLMVALFTGGAGGAAMATDHEVKIGVLAKRGTERCLEKWSPTADYLKAKIPGKDFVIIPIDFGKINQNVETGQVDFVLANPFLYIELEHK